MKINNPFLLLIIILQGMAAIYYWKNSQIELGFVNMFVAFANIALMQIK